MSQIVIKAQVAPFRVFHHVLVVENRFAEAKILKPTRKGRIELFTLPVTAEHRGQKVFRQDGKIAIFYFLADVIHVALSGPRMARSQIQART